MMEIRYQGPVSSWSLATIFQAHPHHLFGGLSGEAHILAALSCFMSWNHDCWLFHDQTHMQLRLAEAIGDEQVRFSDFRGFPEAQARWMHINEVSEKLGMHACDISGYGFLVTWAALGMDLRWETTDAVESMSVCG